MTFKYMRSDVKVDAFTCRVHGQKKSASGSDQNL